MVEYDDDKRPEHKIPLQSLYRDIGFSETKDDNLCLMLGLVKGDYFTPGTACIMSVEAAERALALFQSSLARVRKNRRKGSH